MNKIEKLALEYLINEKGYSKDDIVFRSKESPDFLTISDNKGYEIKRRIGRNGKAICFTEKQIIKLREMNNVEIMIFDNYNKKPVNTFPSNELEIGTVRGFSIYVARKNNNINTNSVHLDPDVHDMILEKQKEIKKLDDLTIQMSEIVNNLIRRNIAKYRRLDDIIIFGTVVEIIEDGKGCIIKGYEVNNEDTETLTYIARILPNTKIERKIIVGGEILIFGLYDKSSWKKTEGLPVIDSKKIVIFRSIVNNVKPKQSNPNSEDSQLADLDILNEKRIEIEQEAGY